MQALGEHVAHPVEEEELRQCYEERSRLVHTGLFDAAVLGSPEHDGIDPQGFTAERRHLFGLHEEILRRALNRCVVDPVSRRCLPMQSRCALTSRWSSCSRYAVTAGPRSYSYGLNLGLCVPACQSVRS